MHACFAFLLARCGLAGGTVQGEGWRPARTGRTGWLAVALCWGVALGALLGLQSARASVRSAPIEQTAQPPMQGVAAQDAASVATEGEGAGKALSRQDLLDQATAASKAQQTIEALPDGRMRMRAPMQALEVRIGPGSAQFSATGAGGDGAFAWHLAAWGREGQLTPAQRGQLRRDRERVSVTRGALQEHFTASSNGIRQDFELMQRPQGEGELLLHLTARGASLAPLNDTDQAMALTLDDGRVLHYHALQVTDATGKHLPARMALLDGQVLRIAVQDAGATYPLLVDPTFTDADWTSIAGPYFDGAIRAMAYDPDGQVLYVGGSFSESPSGHTNYVAQWDGSAWGALGSGMNSDVYALAWASDVSGRGRLYAGGSFTRTGGDPAHYVAQWDGQMWSGMGWRQSPWWVLEDDGVNSTVYALAWAPNGAGGGSLYAGGRFTMAGGVAASRVAQWDGRAWRALGSGLNNQVNALAWAPDGSGGGSLYAGGSFTMAGGSAAHHVAQWDGRAWGALGSGLNSDVNALAWVPNDAGSGRLYAGGSFITAGGAAASRVAQWDGSVWRALGSGVNNQVNALAWMSDAAGRVGESMFVAGIFSQAGGKPAVIAKARIAQTSYTLTYTAGVNGAITGTSPQTVAQGASGTAVTAVPAAGHHFTQWSDGNTNATRTDTNVQAALNVTASFAQTSHTLTYTAGANGRITGTSPQTVAQGASGTAVTAVPAAGYQFVRWSDGVTTAARTDTNVQAALNVTASFAQTSHTLTYTAGANGRITGITPQTVTQGGSGTAVTAVPAAGYQFVRWSDGVTTAARTDADVQADVAVSAEFAPLTTSYTGSLPRGGQGTVHIANASGTCALMMAEFTDALPANAPPSHDFVHGLLRFEGQGCPGETTVRLVYPQALPLDAVFYKHAPAAAGEAANWFELGAADVQVSADRTEVRFVVVDDGRGDADPVATRIRDPFGVALPQAAPAAPVEVKPVSSLGAGALVVLSGLLASAAAWRRRRTAGGWR